MINGDRLPSDPTPRHAPPSAPLACAWAKFGRGRDTTRGWLPLITHAQDAAGVMGHLIDSWLPPSLLRNWAQHFPDGSSDVRIFLSFLASVHDVGKLSPAFASQVSHLYQRMNAQGLRATAFSESDRRTAPHSIVGQWALEEWAAHRGVTSRAIPQLAGAIGAHHGRIAEPSQIRTMMSRDWLTGCGTWSTTRGEFLDLMSSITGADARWASWSNTTIPLPDLVNMLGLLVISDWLASNETFFPYFAADQFDDLGVQGHAERTADGYAEVAFPHAWAPAPNPDRGDAAYHKRFQWDESRHARQLQVLLDELSRDPTVRLLIVESPTGSGKTEAALIAGENLAATQGLAGMGIFLPTQATTNAMFFRVLNWLRALPELPEDEPAWAISLAHGKATQEPRFARLVEAVRKFDEADRAGTGKEIHDEDYQPHSGNETSQGESNLVAHSWFRGRQRPLLANFSVGTIDQLLMSALKSKHLPLRHLALSTKVCIVDEIHASDEYMTQYLDRALNWLGARQTPMVLLSATLTGQRRRELVEAYAKHLGPIHTREVGEARGYPLVTVVHTDGQVSVHDVTPMPSRQVAIEWSLGDDEHVIEQVSAIASGCVLIIRNTVKRAQQTARALTAAGLGPVTLAHSRFMAVDRAANDAELERLFGPVSDRPERHFVVATQVAEQSLDVDFDLLLTDVAPIDLIFQRIGRLHRHQRPRPPGLEDPRCVIMVDTLPTSTEPLKSDSGSEYVYGAWPLLRTGLVLLGRSSLSLPSECPGLLNDSIDPNYVVPAPWAEVLTVTKASYDAEAEKRRMRAQTFLLPDWDGPRSRQRLDRWFGLGPSTTDPEGLKGQALVRDAEPTLEVILVPVDEYGMAQAAPWLSDLPADVRSIPSNSAARHILGWSIKLPPQLTKFDDLDAVIKSLNAEASVNRWDWHLHPLLRGELFLPMRITPGRNEMTFRGVVGNKHWSLRYGPDTGLEVIDQ